jgi:hypothetical protein
MSIYTDPEYIVCAACSEAGAPSNTWDVFRFSAIHHGKPYNIEEYLPNAELISKDENEIVIKARLCTSCSRFRTATIADSFKSFKRDIEAEATRDKAREAAEYAAKVKAEEEADERERQQAYWLDIAVRRCPEIFNRPVGTMYYDLLANSVCSGHDTGREFIPDWFERNVAKFEEAKKQLAIQREAESRIEELERRSGNYNSGMN